MLPRLLPWRQITLLAVAASVCLVTRGETEPYDRLMKGTPHETAVFVSEGAAAGATVVIIGGCHGDETAGYLAADKMVNWKMTKGTLVLVPRAHVTAIARKTRGYPGNMNRMFPGKPDGDMMERLAFSLWALIKQWQPALLVTLHESRGFHSQEPTAFGQTLTYDFQELRASFDPIIEQANKLIRDKSHHFSTYVYPVETCPTYLAYKQLGIPSTSIETCRKLKLETRVHYQLLLSRLLMRSAGLQWQEPGAAKAAPAKTNSGVTSNARPVAADEGQDGPPTPVEVNAPGNAAVPPPRPPVPSGKWDDRVRLAAVAVCAFLGGMFTQAAFASFAAGRRRSRRRTTHVTPQ